jgi:phosphonate transport system substrate-binding protein
LSKGFIDFVYSAAGEKIIQSNGLIPEHRKIVIALLPAINIVEQEARYRPLIDYLSRKCGIAIDVEYSASYEEVVQKFSHKAIDGAFLGSFAYALVNKRVPLEVLGRPEINGQSYYTGILFVRHDSRIQKFEDLKGKSFCFVDKATTAGYLFPLIYFKEHGVIKPEDFLGKILFAGTHDASILSVLNGEADAGVAKDLVMMKTGDKDPRIALELIMVDTSLPVPTNGLSVRKNIDPDLKEEIQDAMLKMAQDPEGREVLKRFGADGFVPTRHEDYKNLYTMIEALEIDLDHFLEDPDHQFVVHKTLPQGRR